MPISKDFTSVFFTTWEINFLQCYPNGYLKYTELCNILQLTAAKHAELGGISFSDMQTYNQAWVLSKMRLEINYLPKWKDKITVKTWIQSLENSRSTRCLEMYLNDQKIIGCETFWAVFNTQTRRPENLALPHNHFEKYPHNTATQKSFSKINIPATVQPIANHTIQLSDLDIVNHVNNVKYLEWCLNGYDFEAIIKKKITTLEMNFLKELSLLDQVTIAKHTSNLHTVFTVEKENKTCFILEIE